VLVDDSSAHCAPRETLVRSGARCDAVPEQMSMQQPGDRRVSLELSAIRADITTLDVDVIANAANSSLLGGGGVDGAIHRAAGPDLLHECRLLGGCETGEAKATRGHRLRARHIVHTVGPVWRGGMHGEAALLADCYRNALAVADRLAAREVAFPAISTGIYRFPKDAAARIAVETVHAFKATHLSRAVFCCFDDADLARYLALLASMRR
jgi:O-acetyl-ADP-ribose deacetylase (regulator of RNase III)